MYQNIYTHQEVSKEEKLFSILVVFMALLHVYHPPSIPISFGEILMLVCMPLYFKRGLKFPFDRQELGFLIFFCYMAISSMVMGIVFDAPMSKYFSIARAGFYWVLIFYFGKNLFSRVIFEKWMIIFSVVLSCFILVQYLVYILTGNFIPGLLAGLPINNGGESGAALYEHSLYLASFRGFVRPHGFLAEPAHCCEFLFISMLTLICKRDFSLKNKAFFVILFSLATFATQSTTGIILCCLVWLVFVSLEKKLAVYRIPLVLFLCSVCVYVLFLGGDKNFFAIERVLNMINGSEIDGSSNVRLNNGFRLFLGMPIVYKMFGTGTGLFEYVSIVFDFQNAQDFMNALSGILFNTGIIGFLIWIVSLACFFVGSGLLGKCMTVGFFVVTLGSSIYCQPQMVWFFLLILADIRERNYVFRK